jgi:hypothetical protein
MVKSIGVLMTGVFLFGWAGCTTNVENPTVNQQGRGGNTACVATCDADNVTCVGKCTDDKCKVSCEATHSSCVGSCSVDGG